MSFTPAPVIRRQDLVRAATEEVRREQSQPVVSGTATTNWKWVKWVLIGAGAAAVWILLVRSLVPYT